MKIYKFRTLLVLMTAVCLLAGCRSDIDLGNLDGHMEATLGLSMPVGNIKIGIGQVLGLNRDSTPALDTITIGNQGGVLLWSKTLDPTYKTFTAFELKDQINSGNFAINIYDQLKDAQVDFPGLPSLPLMDSTYDVHFIYIPEGYTLKDSWTTYKDTMVLTLSGINQKNVENRVDSAHLDYAHFMLSLNEENFKDLDASWIDTVILTLDDHFIRRDGGENRIQIFPRKDGSPIIFGEKIPLELGKTTLQLMTDPKATASSANVDSVLHAYVYVKYSVPTGIKIDIEKDSKIEGGFTVKDKGLAPTLVWGWFHPTGDMHDEDSVNISSSLEDMPIFNDPTTVLPFSRPIIEAWVKTKVAGDIRIEGDYLRAFKGDHEFRSAFYEYPEDSSKFAYSFPMNECVTPGGTDNIDDSTHLHLRFDRDYGHIDNLFRGGIPERLSYKFNFTFDADSTPQIRIPVTDLSVLLTSKVTMPLTFHEGVSLIYTSKLEDLDISKFSIDSLLGSTLTMKDSSQLGIILRTETTLPFSVKLVFRCLNANGDTIKYKGQPFGLFDKDTLYIHAPGVQQDKEDNWTVEPNEIPEDPMKDNLNWAHLSKAELDLFPQISEIIYSIIIDDKALKEAYQNGVRDVPISESQYIKLRIGITAQIEAAINLVNNEKK